MCNCVCWATGVCQMCVVHRAAAASANHEHSVGTGVRQMYVVVRQECVKCV